MFVPNFEKSIPGYTGHKREQLAPEADVQQPKEPRKYIPGKSDSDEIIGWKLTTCVF